jgi:hypothetical protein
MARFLVFIFAFFMLHFALVAQEPPRLLPASITARTPPAARFDGPGRFPPETLQAVQAVRAAADWLARQSLPSGRLTPGFDPRTGHVPDADHELRQATAALALAEAAAFTGDPAVGATAAQAVLGLLATTRDENGVRTPTTPADRCNPVAFAATLVLAADALPNGPAVDGLVAYLKTQVRADGGVGCGGDPATVDRDGLSAAPGLVLRALAKRQPATANAVANFYRAALRRQFVPEAADALIPGLAALNDSAGVFELADRLASEPPSITTAQGLAVACGVCRAAGDLGRYDRYRRATLAALAQSRTLQYTPYSTANLPPATARRLTGAVAVAYADPTARPDRAAALVLAHLRFLASGAEGQ